MCQNAGGAKLLSLEEAQDKYKQVGPTDLPKYHTVIDIPDIKKKKNKEKDKTKNNSSNLNNSSNTISTPSSTPLSTSIASGNNSNIPINLQIQQQFESLQSSNQTTPIPIIPSASTTASSNTNTNNGSSSPAFKSLFRNLRVGSVKYQQSPSITTSGSAAALAGLSSNTPNNLTQLNNNLNQQTPINSLDNDNLKQTNLSTATPFLQSISSSNSTSLVRTSSTSTFKPPPVASATIGITSPNNSDIKSDYSNCISQLQSNAALALMSSSQHGNSNITSFTGCLSPSSNSNNNQIPTSTGSVLLRTNKLNQSQHSIHSNILNQSNNANTNSNTASNNCVQLTTFSPSANVEMRKSMFFF